jgi:hypothetical protein
MKKLICNLMSAALALSLWSCASERPVDAAAPTGTPALQFTIKTPVEPFVTRADIATPNEWKIATLDVYTVVGSSTNMERLRESTDNGRTGDYIFTRNDAAHTFTLTMLPAWLTKYNSKGDVNFYFVGNDATSGNGTMYNTIGPHDALQGTKTEAVFRNSLTDDLKYWNTLKPNGGTRNLLFSATATVSDISGSLKYRVQLKRRTARFDVEVAESALSYFELSSLLVQGAMSRGLIFGSGDASALSGVSRFDYNVIEGAALAYTGKSEGSSANNLVAGAAYIYPTTIGGTDDMRIIIRGTYLGQIRSYALDVPAGTVISPNYRYTLRVNPALENIELVENKLYDVEDGNTGDWDFSPAAGKYNNSRDIMTETVSGNVFVHGDYSNEGISVVEINGYDPCVFKIYVTTTYGARIDVSNPSGTLSYTWSTSVRGSNTYDTFTITIPANYVDNIGDRINIIVNEDDPSLNFRYIIERNTEPQLDNILYWNSTTGTLDIGRYHTKGGVVTTDNVLFFKFGSVVGFKGNSSTWSQSRVVFDPSTAPATTYQNIPAWNGSDISEGYISSSAYHNSASVLQGRGDPCKLVGFTVAEIQAGSYDNGQWRLPTELENKAIFIGDMELTADDDEGYYIDGCGVTYMDESGGANFLPFLSYFNQDGAFVHGDLIQRFGDSSYWSSTPKSDNSGSCFALNADGGMIDIAYNAQYGSAIRCVPQNQ